MVSNIIRGSAVDDCSTWSRRERREERKGSSSEFALLIESEFSLDRKEVDRMSAKSSNSLVLDSDDLSA